MESKLGLDFTKVEYARGLAKKIADQVQEFVEQYTTVAVERTLSRLMGIDGVDENQVPLPNVVLAVAGWCGDLLRLCGLRTQVSTRNVRQLLVREHYDNARARGELLMPATPVAQAIADFFRWREK